MAGDWIKIEHTLPDKPEVIRMAALLDIDQDAVTGKLLRIWMWADQNSVTGENIPVTRAFLDRMVDCRGFTVAMLAAGWMTGDDGDFSLPNFTRHNGMTAKGRAKNNRDVTNCRKRKTVKLADVSVAPLQSTLPEKSREEKRETTSPLPRREGGSGVVGCRAAGVADLHGIRAGINALRPEWSKPAQWSDAEERLLAGGTASQLGEMTEVDWGLLRRYLSTRMPEGSTYWQPRNRAKFVETFASVFADAQRWESRQRRAPAAGRSVAVVAERSIIPRDQLSQVFGGMTG